MKYGSGLSPLEKSRRHYRAINQSNVAYAVGLPVYTCLQLKCMRRQQFFWFRQLFLSKPENCPLLGEGSSGAEGTSAGILWVL